MEVQDIVNLFVNNGVAIAVIIYFCVRDWRFYDTLIETLGIIKANLDNKNEEVRDRKESLLHESYTK